MGSRFLDWATTPSPLLHGQYPSCSRAHFRSSFSSSNLVVALGAPCFPHLSPARPQAQFSLCLSPASLSRRVVLPVSLLHLSSGPSKLIISTLVAIIPEHFFFSRPSQTNSRRSFWDCWLCWFIFLLFEHGSRLISDRFPLKNGPS